jgi:hypothetical protein
MKQTPADNRIWVPGRNIRTVVLSTEPDASELQSAKKQRMGAISFYVRAKSVSINLD